jgi:hypothetical protein
MGNLNNHVLSTGRKPIMKNENYRAEVGMAKNNAWVSPQTSAAALSTQFRVLQKTRGSRIFGWDVVRDGKGDIQPACVTSWGYCIAMVSK